MPIPYETNPEIPNHVYLPPVCWSRSIRICVLANWPSLGNFKLGHRHGSLVGVFFVSFVWAFLLLLRWRDGRRVMSTKVTPLPLARPDLKGTIYGLLPGRQYRVMQQFIGFYGNSFKQDELLKFKERHFLPYDSGHTVIFDKRMLYLQEDKNKEILEKFSEYIAQVELDPHIWNDPIFFHINLPETFGQKMI